MKVFSLLFLSTLLFFFIACSEDGTGPKPKPVGYQEDVSWPSLADTPWPIFHGDAQSTGRSPYAGPTEGVISAVLEADNSQAGVIIGFDSTFYYTTYHYLVAADFEGNQKWQLLIGHELTTTPLLSKDSVLYIANGGLKTIYAIGLDGVVIWEYKSIANIWNLTLGIDLTGNLYFVDGDKNLNSLSKDGKLNWQLQDERFLPGQSRTFAFSPDGKTIYLHGSTVGLIAVDISQQVVKWTFWDTIIHSGPVVDCEGNIFLFPDGVSERDNYFFSLKPTGEIRWQFKHDEQYQLNNIEPTIDKKGNIYFGYKNLYSLDYNGNLNWKIEFDGVINTSLLCDQLGNIYVSIIEESWLQKILCINKNGNLIWQVQIENERGLSSSGAITEDGLLIYSTWRSNSVYIIK